LNGVIPTSGTIADRAYPLVTGVFAVVRGDTPPESTAVMLRDWLFSQPGRQVIQESGYVPIK
jgi:ABC-type phosphate transport system substrate-binding protein